VPRGVDPEAVRAYLLGLPGVRELHDLHIWAMSTTDTALTVHLVMDVYPRDDGFLADVAQHLDHEFGINHATVQMERETADVTCRQALHCAD
jgi:cobalt-zinc-cadmium efflux system protein